MDIRFRPLEAWPYESTPASSRRSRYTFRAPWSSTLELLQSELDKLGASDVTLEVGLRPSDIRLDGWPRADARVPLHPGVALHFDARDLGHLRYATDGYETWETNVRAIALGLETLRAVDRYGITQGREQYRGFAELPSGIAAGAIGSTMDADEAAYFIASNLGLPDGDVDETFKGLLVLANNGDHERIERAYKLAALRLHPDQGGSPDDFAKLGAARDLLEAIHGR